ncbi:unnamed protein product (macronuclear) [Paramecium tetraurelia]|uniref:Chromosome undetermined scaffold_1, whole genome shotgun sequence n=1 Tax=Paramecium tetraurelia TaxID=5888 RepID=Q6BG07_PARTE|nr:hypothetical protein [Paramecium tetraurelia strain d4-2]XP_001423267.1 uncharacterized protein GSPATT00000304001 [Paramecium tetraurelia]CAH03413.1 hypothetical protein, transmembrane helices [Paramecium tetraurelia]CAK55869.1 unnamed protein product [Paramecium tetraurelia]|eukprot:XP_001423267.1 hypothetical protein (macronuclear) [Paramecium tetraurelia strain d4-2]
MNYLLYIVENAESTEYSIIFYLDIDADLEQIKLKGVFQLQTQSYVFEQLLDTSNLEGDWHLLYYYVDQASKQIIIYLFNSRTKVIFSKQHIGSISYGKKTFQRNFGTFQNIEGSEVVKYKNFPGKLGSIFITFFSDIFTNLEQYNTDCPLFQFCIEGQQSLVGYNQEFKKNKIVSGQTLSNELHKVGYVIQGWVKLNKIESIQQLDTVLLRVTTRYQYFNDKQYGDRLIYIVYHQNIIQDQNGFTVSLNSYKFPIIEETYYHDDLDKITIMGKQYSEAIIYWHYFQYEVGTKTNNGQPLFTMYFAFLNQKQQWKWNKQINHFTNSKFYYFIGGDDFVSNQFSGFLSDWSFSIYCYPVDVQFKIKCHFSCKTCDGISSSNCLSCNSESHRLYSEEQKRCQCAYGYVEVADRETCQSKLICDYKALEETMGNLVIDEYERKCDKVGYFTCNEDNIQCDYGYFLAGNECLMCPRLNFEILDESIECGDCVLAPEIFSSALICSYDFKVLDKSKQFIYQKVIRGAQQQEVFKIVQDEFGKSQLKLIQGEYTYGCKFGYYRDQNGKCKKCMEGCSGCLIDSSCQVCFIGYTLRKDGNCQKCGLCHNCMLENNKEICMFETDCLSNQYWSEQQCYDCGQYCAKCIQSKCLYCINNQGYFISFDKLNCAICNIKDCQYCFQYYQSDDKYYTTLDYEPFMENIQQELIKIGCAQCNQNMYFNFQTNQCEEQLNNDVKCSFGIITKDFGKSICIKSLTPLVGIQQTECLTISFCEQCILNYINTDGFCIKCSDGYYSSITTGQCKQCPLTCKTCQQQNKNHEDFWKWDIKAFYKYFVNSNEDHYFEQYGLNFNTKNFEIVCTSCFSDSFLYQNECFKNCGQDCSNCQIINDYYSSTTQPQSPRCFQCNNALYNKQRSTNQKDLTVCQECVVFCKACESRDVSQISYLNPFITNDSKYTNLCYSFDQEIQQSDEDIKYNIQYKNEINFHPFFKTPYKCQKYDKCIKTLTFTQFVYCDSSYMYYDFFKEERQNYRQLYKTYYQFTVYGVELEDYIYDFLNEQSIIEVNFVNLLKILPKYPGPCFQWEAQSVKIKNPFSSQVFTIKTARIKLIGEELTFLLTQSNYNVMNFDEVHFQNVGILATSTLSHPSTSLYNIYCKISILNEFFPVTFKLIDSQILCANSFRLTSYTIMSNNSLNILFDNVTFLDLNLTDSKLIDFQPLQSTKNPKFHAQNLVFINSNFTKSSIFCFESLKFSPDYQISISNVYASNLTFRAGSQFIYTSFLLQYHVGYITLENLYFQNITLMNASQLLNLMGSGSCSIKNLTLKNIIFLDSSSFLLSNIINIEDFLAINIIINTGYLITNKGTSSKATQALKNAESIRIKNASFIENIYHNSQCFIAIFQNQISNNSLIIEGLTLKNNQYYNILKGVNSIKSLTNDQSLIYLECQVCILDKVEILRGLGYPEIAIFQSKVLKFSNIIIQQSPQYITKTLHSSYKCIEQFLYLDIYFVFYLSSFNQVELDNVVIFQSVIFDNSFFLFASQNQFDDQVENSIVIKNSKFFDNMLIVTQQNKFTSIIYIKTEQLMNINIVNTNFTQNFLNEYFQDYQLFSSSTLVIYAQSSEVIISNCFFDQNIISNSTDSNLFIKANYLNISNSVFTKQNQLNPTIFEKYLFVSKTDTEISSNIMLNFQVLSSGGNGYLLINSALLEQIQVEQSLALNGGAFYIITTQQGSIEISNSKFINTSTTINGYQISVGGCFYIDSSKSRFNLNIHDSIFQLTSSRTQAGLLYIEPSFLKNEINLDNLTIQESFSIQNSILTFSPSRQNSVYSNFKISNSLIINSENAFNYYISQLQDISSQDVKPFQRENPTMYVQYCNFTMVNCSFIQFHIATILEIYNGYLINLNNIEILNSTYYLSPILRISLREGFMGKILLQDFKLQKLQQYQTQIEDCQEVEIVATKDLLCFDDLSDIVQNPLVELKKYNLTNQLICNKKLIFEEANYNMSLIEIKSIDNEQELLIENLLISNIECSNCYFGVFTVQDVKVNSMNLRLKNVSLINNTCGVIGCLSFLQNSNFNLNENQQNRILQNSVEKIKNIQNKQIQLKISNSLFINNIADYGGACFFIDLNMLIEKCLFNNNQARETGGAIYYYSEEQNHILILDSQLIQNKAQIGGGLYQNGETIQELTKGNVYIKENLGTKYADNLASVPMYLSLSLDGLNLLKNKLLFKNQTTQIDEVEVQPYYYLGAEEKTDQILVPSGLKIYDYKHFDAQSNSYIDYNFSFRLIPLNIQFEQMKNLNGTECTINPSVVNTSNIQEKIQNILENISAQSLSYTQVKFNDQTQDYNLDNLTVYFNPLQEQQYSLQLAFICKAIKIPVFNNYSPYELNYTLDNYILLLHLRTFKCQLGEYLNSTSGGCVQCDITQNQYSVQENAQACQFKNEQKMKSIKPAMIELRSGYWRAYYYSNVVELCYHQQQNCQGGWFAGNPSCGLGHIGALCEQCDLYNIRGQGYFSISQAYGCSGCEQVAKNIINIVLVVLWTLLSLFISVTSTVQMIEEFIFQLKLKSLRNYMITQPTSTSVLLKVFTNYLQIISSITSFQLSIPSGISLVVSGVGNPMDSMAFSLDCFLADSIEIVPILYFRIIFSLLTIGIYIMLFFSIYIMLLFLKKGKFQITFMTTTFIYIYIYLFPNIVSGLIGLLSYRKISNEFWVSGNVSYLYNTYQHTIWLISFVIPSLFILGLFIPFLFWFVVYYNRKQLNSMKVRKMWGYLYNEYKLETYYWETLKILQKEIIILVLLYYSDYVAVKASLVFLILYIYSHLSTKYKPYQSAPLNKIDFLSTSICSISIVLASSIYTAQSFDIIEVVLPFYTILAVLNFLFVANMLQKLVYAYFDKMEKTIDEIKTIIYLKFPHIINKNRTLKRIFIKNSLRKKLIKDRFKMVRLYLINQAQQIIEFKSYLLVIKLVL